MAVTRRLASRLMVFGFAGVVVFVFAGSQIRAGSVGVQRADASPADSSATYEFEDMKVIYPYEAPDGPKEQTGFARVTYTIKWAGDSYPGDVACQIELTDDSGKVVGTLDGSWDSLEPVVTSDDLSMIPVDGIPASASFQCGSSSYPADANYAVTGFAIGEVDPLESPTGVTAVAHWTTEVSPGTRGCTAELQTASGTVTEGFTLAVPDGNRFFVPLPGNVSVDALLGLDIACEPLSRDFLDRFRLAD